MLLLVCIQHSDTNSRGSRNLAFTMPFFNTGIRASFIKMLIFARQHQIVSGRQGKAKIKLCTYPKRKTKHPYIKRRVKEIKI